MSASESDVSLALAVSVSNDAAGPPRSERGFLARGLVGRSRPMRELNELITRIAVTSNSVLVVGETGTGKELVARAIHAESDRRDQPFVAVSCASQPEGLLEGELFGQVRSAFPGALRSRRGAFVEADGGTLFLDEIGELPLTLQARLLGMLESGEIRPVGGGASRVVDVRCIASTQADLAERVRVGAFRKDLFFRLNVIPVRVPPLRERSEDIPLLVEHFLARSQGRSRPGAAWSISDDGLRALEGHSWPGNVRELHNLVERLVTTGGGAPVDLPAVRATLGPALPGDPVEALAMASVPLEELEARYTAAVLRLTQGDKPRAAAILGIDLSTLYRRFKRTRA